MGSQLIYSFKCYQNQDQAFCEEYIKRGNPVLKSMAKTCIDFCGGRVSFKAYKKENYWYEIVLGKKVAH